MRITILTSYEGISALVLSRIVPRLSEHQISCLYTSPKEKLAAPARLQALANYYDATVLRAHRGIFEELEGRVVNDVNGKDFDAYSSTAPDLLVSLRHMSILGSRAIEVPRFGVGEELGTATLECGKNGLAMPDGTFYSMGAGLV